MLNSFFELRATFASMAALARRLEPVLAALPRIELVRLSPETWQAVRNIQRAYDPILRPQPPRQAPIGCSHKGGRRSHRNLLFRVYDEQLACGAIDPQRPFLAAIPGIKAVARKAVGEDKGLNEKTIYRVLGPRHSARRKILKAQR